MSFRDLERDELYRTAIEDFAVEVHHNAGAEKIIDALESDGVTWEMYVALHPEADDVTEDEGQVVETPSSVISLGQPDPAKSEVRVRTRTKEVSSQVNDNWLVFMERENPSFQFKGDKTYKFTQENPFQVMSANDANRITAEEEGFAIATPAQAQAFYGG